MPLKVMMVTGPRRSGKSTLIEAMIEEVCPEEPHYIRLATSDGSKRAPRGPLPPRKKCGVSTATWVDYDPSRIFETLPAALSAVHRRDHRACVIIEADTDPNLRHAYPYDTQVFTMSAPENVHDVFRTPEEAKAALQSVLHDTHAFAGEIYGVFTDDDSVTDGEVATRESRADMSEMQIISLLHSPLGEELASRIQCRPEYHGLIESDFVVVNTGIGGTSAVVDEVVNRLEKLAHRARAAQVHQQTVFCCDLCDRSDPRRKSLFGDLRRVYAESPAT